MKFEKIKQGNLFHLAGIIPVSCQSLDFGMPWPDCMQPINKGYLLIERAIMECATAGCETIWIIAPQHIQPLLRRVIGEYVEDPNYYYKFKAKWPALHKKYIPIYYVPIHPIDQERRGSLVWSIIYGAQIASKVCKGLSKYVDPNRFYVAYPYGIYPVNWIREYRGDISSHERRFVVCGNNRTFKDGQYVGFTFNKEDLKNFKKIFREKENRVWDKKSEIIDGKYSQMIPVEKRYTGRFLTLGDIFENIEIGEKATIVEAEWYYSADNWNGLRDYLASSRNLRKPARFFRKKRISHKIGKDIE